MSISNFCKKHENFISNLITALVTTLTAICGWIFTNRNVQKQIKNNEYTQMASEIINNRPNLNVAMGTYQKGDSILFCNTIPNNLKENNIPYIVNSSNKVAKNVMITINTHYILNNYENFDSKYICLSSIKPGQKIFISNFPLHNYSSIEIQYESPLQEEAVENIQFDKNLECFNSEYTAFYDNPNLVDYLKNYNNNDTQVFSNKEFLNRTFVLRKFKQEKDHTVTKLRIMNY